MEKKQSIEAKSCFRFESKVVKYIENLYRLFVLNVLFIVTSLPVLTIGIAQISLYDSVKKLKEEPYNHPSSIFIQSVKTNWRQGLRIGFLEILLTFVLLLDMMILNTHTGNFSFVLKVIFYGISILMTVIMLYLIPLSLKKKETKIKELCLDSFLLACIHLPRSLGLMALYFTLFQLFQLTVLFTMAMVSLFLVLGFSSFAYIQSIIIEKIIEKELNN